VEVVAILLDARRPPEPEEVGEALGGHERDGGAGSLQDHVGGECRPVHETRDVGGVDARIAEHLADAAHDALDRVGGCGRDLGRVQRACGAREHEVGEGAADVGADPCHSGSSP